jgi:hypothetical protein
VSSKARNGPSTGLAPWPPASSSTTGRSQTSPWRARQAAASFGWLKTGWTGMPVTAVASSGTPNQLR